MDRLRIIFISCFALTALACSKPNSASLAAGSGSPTPTTAPNQQNGPSEGLTSSREAGLFDTNCLNQAQYDACIIWKNPVASRGSAFPVMPQFGMPLKEQNFGVKIKGLTNEFSLANKNIRITATSAPLAGPTPQTAWRFPYAGDASNHFVAQVMAYFWLNHLDEQMMLRSGNYYVHGKNIEVDAYNANITNNAYWDGQKIILGVGSVRATTTLEMALGSEIYLHEMGHANLQFAMKKTLNDVNASQGRCLTEAGCLTALSEGIADFHALMIFFDSTALGETLANNPNGVSQNNVSRDVAKVGNLKFADFYNRTNGEIHGMGTAYASILWDIYTHPDINRLDFEKIFMHHLQLLTDSSRFKEGRDALVSSDLVLFAGKYSLLIENIFQNRGL
jgi:hypothetical protein